MSLDFHIGDIESHEQLWVPSKDGEGKQLDGITHALVFATMATDLGAVTEQNLPEWCWRLAFLEQIGKGRWLNEWGEDGKLKCERNFTVGELRRRIGLRTNVVSESRAKFVRKWTDHLRRESDWQQRRMLEGRA